MSQSKAYGIVASFDSPRALLDAAREVRAAGYRRFEAYTPYPIKDLDEVVPGSDPLPLMVLLSGAFGTLVAWSMQFLIATVDYPINVGGRPLNSWPSFVPIMFELTVLFAASAAFFGTLWLCGLPMPHHPLFNVAEFSRASSDRFFLCIEAHDPLFSDRETRNILQRLEPTAVWAIGED